MAALWLPLAAVLLPLAAATSGRAAEPGGRAEETGGRAAVQRAREAGRWVAARHGSPVLAVARLEPGGRTAVALFDGEIGVHGGFGDDERTFKDIAGGWPVMLSNLKTILETGDGLPWPRA